jgi:uncharacterized protein (TIGR03066 family)
VETSKLNPLEDFMRTFGKFVAVVALATLIAGINRADDKKIDKAKLVGKWKVLKAEGAPPGTIVEFTKDGKLKVTIDMDGNKIELAGTYKVEGEKLHTAMKLGDKEETDIDTIKTLTDAKLHLVDKVGKEAELEKVK